MSPKELNDETLKVGELGKDKIAVVDFWAPWCGPCKILGPILDEVSKEFPDKADIYKVDMDKCPGVAAEHNIVSIPTLLFIKDGKIIDRHTGLLPKNGLMSKISSLSKA
jgi:thioredoxin 1